MTPEQRHTLLNDFQRDFPLTPRPFLAIAEEAGLSEEDVLAFYKGCHADGTLSRVGAVVRPNTVGVSTLAAVAAPPERLSEVAEMISAHPEVNHNYEREHVINLWFVVAACDEAALRGVLVEIEQETGLAVLDLPLERPFHIDLGFDLS